tara:strand:- start:1938 stop:2444 length:507 start_codon:yes stop_codon:yes gene_type:complete
MTRISGRKLFQFDIATEKSDLLLTFLETRDSEKNIGFLVNFGIKSNHRHEFGNMDINIKTNNHEFYKIMNIVFYKIMDFLKDNPKYSFLSFMTKIPILEKFYQRMGTKRWLNINIKKNKDTGEVYIYREGMEWKGEVFKTINTKDEEIPQEPFDYFEFPRKAYKKKYN